GPERPPRASGPRIDPALSTRQQAVLAPRFERRARRRTVRVDRAPDLLADPPRERRAALVLAVPHVRHQLVAEHHEAPHQVRLAQDPVGGIDLDVVDEVDLPVLLRIATTRAARHAIERLRRHRILHPYDASACDASLKGIPSARVLPRSTSASWPLPLPDH